MSIFLVTSFPSFAHCLVFPSVLPRGLQQTPKGSVRTLLSCESSTAAAEENTAWIWCVADQKTESKGILST